MIQAFWAGLLMTAVGFSAEPSPVSEAELAQHLKLYESVTSIESTFVQVKSVADMGLQLKSEGRFKIERPDHITWEVLKPAHVLVTLDPSQIRIESGDPKHPDVQVLKKSDAPSDQANKSLSGLVAWLNLDAKALSEQYSVTRSGPKGNESFKFVPKDPGKGPFRAIEMTLGDHGHLQRLVIHETSGDAMDIRFGQPKLTRKGA